MKEWRVAFNNFIFAWGAVSFAISLALAIVGMPLLFFVTVLLVGFVFLTGLFVYFVFKEFKIGQKKGCCHEQI